MFGIDIVGCGEVALQYHAPVLQHLRSQGIARVRGCYDRDVGRALRLCKLVRGERWGAAAPPKPDDDVQAVLVATPPQSHADVALGYVTQGRSALIEKPFVGRRTDADRILRAAKASGARVLVGHMRRLYPSVRIARDFVLAGGLGPVRRVTACEGGRWGAWAAASNYVVEDQLGGVVFDTGAHVLDTLLFVLGADQARTVAFDITRVSRDRTSEPSQDFRAVFTVTVGGGAPIPVHFAVSRTESLAATIRVEGDRGMLLLPSPPMRAPRVAVGGRVFTLDHPEAVTNARDVLGVFKQQYVALVRASQHSDEATPLDAHRFLALTDLLERLSGLETP